MRSRDAVAGVVLALAACAVFAHAPVALASSTTFSGVGGTNTSGGALSALSAFEAAIGGANNGAGGPQPGGFRTVNWDGVPDGFADPNQLPGSFYNANSTRGLVLATPGSGVEVSGGAAPYLGFGDINATYPSDFPAFSPTRVFSPIGSNLTDLTFYAAGTATHATVRGFGAIFRDVEVANTSSIEYFDQAGHSLGKFFVPVGTKGQAEFLGVLFSPETVARVEITSGTTALGPNDNPPTTNVVVLDDFAYTEPQALPSPTLTISSPTEAATVGEMQLTVSGTASDPSGIVSLTLNGALVPVGPDGSWTKQLTLAPGSNAIAVVATNAYGNSSQALRAVTYAPPTLVTANSPSASPSGASDGALPAVGSETLTPSRFPAAPAGPSAFAARRSFGTRVTYTLNEAATVRFTVLRATRGRSGSGGRCARSTPANRRAPACTRLSALPGSFTLAGNAGVNHLRFTGRLDGAKLKVGKYSLVATPSTSAGAGRAASASFQIVQ
jgi:hypothetical protein